MLINHLTSLVVVFSLLEKMKDIKTYIIDTEHDILTTQPALIQVELVDDNEKESTVLLFEMAHLPPLHSHRFRYIQKLFAAILQPSNKIYTWDNVQKELLDFIRYGVFSVAIIRSIQPYDVQFHFKGWYNGQFPHNQGCLGLYDGNDTPFCDCQYRPYKYNDHQWGLQLAVAKTFGEFLDKRLRKSTWSSGLACQFDVEYENGLPLKEYSSAFHQRSLHRRKLIIYASHDCLSVTKLAMIVENKWIRQQLEQFNREQSFSSFS
jgi:hypothetical protein